MHYTVNKLQGLAVVYPLHKFRSIVLCDLLIICTNHNALAWLIQLQDAHARLRRWLAEVQAFEYSLAYVRCNEEQIVVADLFSEAPASETAEEDSTPELLAICGEEATDGDRVTCTVAAFASDAVDEAMVQSSTTELLANLLGPEDGSSSGPGPHAKDYPMERFKRARLRGDVEEEEKPASEPEEEFNEPPQLKELVMEQEAQFGNLMEFVRADDDRYLWDEDGLLLRVTATGNVIYVPKVLLERVSSHYHGPPAVVTGMFCGDTGSCGNEEPDDLPSFLCSVYDGGTLRKEGANWSKILSQQGD